VVRLLRDYAVDPDLPAGEDKLIRQVVPNSHSPEVLKQLKLSEVLFVETLSDRTSGSALVSALEGGWRRDGQRTTIARLREILGGAPYDAELGKHVQLPLPFVIRER
jgi:hypothetical protein